MKYDHYVSTDTSRTFRIHNDVKRPSRLRIIPPVLLTGLILVLLAVTVDQLVGVARGGQHNPMLDGKSRTDIKAEYDFVVNGIADRRRTLYAAWQDATGTQARRKVVATARTEVTRAILDEIVPYWIGTPWAFHGMTETPGSGEIACGYFVATVLRDAGVRLDRVSLAQQPSELMIRSLVAEENIYRYSDLSGRAFLERLHRLPSGVYILGLDKHVGLLVLSESAPVFIHSSYLRPYGVVREQAATSRALMRSRYRVLGNLTGDSSFLLKWLGGERIRTLQE
ncbi:MAG TPA: peptidoglycan endopeptidase [Spirochaetia bacterium]|nr:peptidoglycan endopeptidase [Spirochaetia bacterium]